MPKRDLIGALNLHRYSTTSTWHYFSYNHPYRDVRYTHLSGDIHLKIFKMNILWQIPVRITVATADLYLDISQQQDWQSQDVTIHLQAAGNWENLLTSFWDQKEPEPSTQTVLFSLVQSSNSEVHFLDPLKSNCLVHLMPEFYLLICIWGTC